MRRVFITVAEVSADHHAAALARALRALDPQIVIEAHGGTAMRDAGIIVHRDTVRRATMLIRAVLRGFEFWKLIRWTRRHFQQQKPDLHICIDSSGINLHFAKMARGMGVPTLYYIAPQLWASRPRRIKKVRRYINRVACILPFEEEYYRSRGVEATFVGHPLFDSLPSNRLLSPEPREFTADSPPVIGVMPGSRRSEIHRHLPRMFEVMDRIADAFPGTKFEIPTTPPTHELVTEMSRGRKDLRIEQGAINAMALRWDFCLAKSGTTTLHVAAYGAPMIVVYHLNKFMGFASRWFVHTPSIALVNILAQRGDGVAVPKERIVPEIFPWNGPTAPVSEVAIDFLRNVEKRREQRRHLLAVIGTLDREGASNNAARIVMEMTSRPG